MPPFVLPKLPSRVYVRFGEPVSLEGLDKSNRAACQDKYEHVKVWYYCCRRGCVFILLSRTRLFSQVPILRCFTPPPTRHFHPHLHPSSPPPSLQPRPAACSVPSPAPSSTFSPPRPRLRPRLHRMQLVSSSDITVGDTDVNVRPF